MKTISSKYLRSHLGEIATEVKEKENVFVVTMRNIPQFKIEPIEKQSYEVDMDEWIQNMSGLGNPDPSEKDMSDKERLRKRLQEKHSKHLKR